MLDVYLDAELARPEARIKVARLHMSGVTKAMLMNSMSQAGSAPEDARATFADLRVVLRIIPAQPGVLDFGVVVVRDEAGNVFSSDVTGSLRSEQTWLARRAGRRSATAAAQHDGAVALLNDLLQVVIPIKALDAIHAVTTDAG